MNLPEKQREIEAAQRRIERLRRRLHGRVAPLAAAAAACRGVKYRAFSGVVWLPLLAALTAWWMRRPGRK